jgi:hypothetical protein
VRTAARLLYSGRFDDEFLDRIIRKSGVLHPSRGLQYMMPKVEQLAKILPSSGGSAESALLRIRKYTDVACDQGHAPGSWG